MAKIYETADAQHVGRVELYPNGSKVLFLDSALKEKAPVTDEFTDILQNVPVYVIVSGVSYLVTAFKKVSAAKVELTANETVYFLGQA